jgi:hypothetical protein
MTTLLSDLSIEQLRRAVSLKEQIAGLETQLSQVVGAPAPATLTAKRPGSRKRSAAVRARMAAAQRARWAQQQGKEQAAVKPAPASRKPKGKLSPEGRARIVAAQKARWAKIRAREGK